MNETRCPTCGVALGDPHELAYHEPLPPPDPDERHMIVLYQHGKHARLGIVDLGRRHQ